MKRTVYSCDNCNATKSVDPEPGYVSTPVGWADVHVQMGMAIADLCFCADCYALLVKQFPALECRERHRPRPSPTSRPSSGG